MAKPDKKFRVLVIGAGMSGILAGIKLREAGIDNFVIYEKGDRIGGTWRDNRYPGLACDVPSHSYTYSFEPKPDWSMHFSPGHEIQAYFENVVRKYDLTRHIRCNQALESCTFEGGRWQVQMQNGVCDEADFIIAATGVLHYPKFPAIDGLSSFAGPIVHSALWDDELVLEGKRIGVIGNGSTGVQIVSALAESCKVTHFQRSAQWILHVDNPAFSTEEIAAFSNDAALLKSMQCPAEYQQAVLAFTDAITDAESEGIKEISAATLANLEESVSDPVLKEQLRPDYLAACKRLIRSPDYYQAIQHSNSTLVSAGIKCIDAQGVHTHDGQLHELDVLLLATGFHADRFLRPATVYGRNGLDIETVWAQRPTAYMATSMPGFPNLMMLNGPTGPIGNFSVIEIAEYQIAYIMQLLEQVRSGACREICVTVEAHAAYEEARIDAAKKTVFGSGCQSWYLDSHGVPSSWPWSLQQFIDDMSEPKWVHYEQR